jgi:hypothetical protein
MANERARPRSNSVRSPRIAALAHPKPMRLVTQARSARRDRPLRPGDRPHPRLVPPATPAPRIENPRRPDGGSSLATNEGLVRRARRSAGCRSNEAQCGDLCGRGLPSGFERLGLALLSQDHDRTDLARALLGHDTADQRGEGRSLE